MRISILLAVIILVCAACLILLLYPRETETRARQAVRKRKAIPSPAPSETKAPVKQNDVPEQTEEAPKSMSEAEAIRQAVRTFADEDPSTTARILKSWMKK